MPGQRRLLNDWLTKYMDYTKHSESPLSFHLWAGISAIAASLQRRIYMRWGYQIIYPNNYIILVGPSGASRKSEPINISRALVEKVDNVRILGEDNSQEAIIREMKNAVTNFTDKSTKKITFQCAVSTFLEELSVFTGQQNTQFLAYLTNWYDSRDKWKRTTKHQGTDEIMGMCFNMLAATAPDWIPYILPGEAIGGGFTSRCIFVVESRKSKVVSNPNLTPEDAELRQRLVHDLQLVNTLSGEMRFDTGALELYCQWYEQEEDKTARGVPAVRDPLFAGYNARRATHVKKLGMVMSASRGSDMVVTTGDFKRALALMEAAEKKMPQAFTGVGRARYGEETQLVLNYLALHGQASKSEILQQFHRSIDTNVLDIVIKVLDGMKAIRVEIGRSDTMYVYKGPTSDLAKT